jgi:hypothetical protein
MPRASHRLYQQIPSLKECYETRGRPRGSGRASTTSNTVSIHIRAFAKLLKEPVGTIGMLGTKDSQFSCKGTLCKLADAIDEGLYILLEGATRKELKPATWQYPAKYSEPEPWRMKLHLTSRISNLGTGLVWFFRCPATGKPCRILYKLRDMAALYSRAYIEQTLGKRIYYPCQMAPGLSAGESEIANEIGRNEERIYARLKKLDKGRYCPYHNGQPARKALQRAELVYQLVTLEQSDTIKAIETAMQYEKLDSRAARRIERRTGQRPPPLHYMPT